MPKTKEEFTKDLKDRALEAKFKNVRNGLKIALSQYMLEPENKDFERVVDSFAGLDPKSGSKREKSFIDDLLMLGKAMDDVFRDIKDSEGLALLQKLNTISQIYMDRVAELCLRLKIDNFPRYKEKFDMGMTEEQEAKSVVPKTIFYSVKLYIDRYYLLFRAYSINVKSKALFLKLAEIRESIINFEYNIAYNLSRVDAEHVKEVVAFKRNMKITLMRLRKLFEAFDASNFGKLSRTLYGIGIENGIRVFIKYYPEVTMKRAREGLNGNVSLKSILDNYEKFMFPVRQIAAEMDASGFTVGRRGFKKVVPAGKESSKAFWDIADQIRFFREGMHKVIGEMGAGLPATDSEYKFFTHTVQAVILPYVSQSRGENNDSFVIGVNNLDIFFWKLLFKIIENAQDNGESVDEILGLSIKVDDREIKLALATLNKETDGLPELPDDNGAE